MTFEYLRDNLGRIPVEIRGSSHIFCPKNYLDNAKKLASIKILDARCKLTSRQSPSYGEVQYEQRRRRLRFVFPFAVWSLSGATISQAYRSRQLAPQKARNSIFRPSRHCSIIPQDVVASENVAVFKVQC